MKHYYLAKYEILQIHPNALPERRGGEDFLVLADSESDAEAMIKKQVMAEINYNAQITVTFTRTLGYD